MDAPQVLDLGREAIIVLLKVGAPIMLIALAVGLIISLVQALTQMQEATLSFVPKMLVISVALVFLAPYMLATLIAYTQGLFDRIVAIGM